MFLDKKNGLFYRVVLVILQVRRASEVFKLSKCHISDLFWIYLFITSTAPPSPEYWSLQVTRVSLSLTLVATRLQPHASLISLLLCLSGFVPRAEPTPRLPSPRYRGCFTSENGSPRSQSSGLCPNVEGWRQGEFKSVCWSSLGALDVCL